MKRFLIFLLLLLTEGIINPSGFCQKPCFKTPEEEIEEYERRFLEELKKENPQAYKEFLERRKKDKERSQIIELYRQRKISEAEARKRLRPFVEEEVNLERFLTGIDEQIKMLEEEIKRLKKIKKNPHLLIEERIDSYLGIVR